MARAIKNDASMLQPSGTALTMTIDNTNNQVDANVAAFASNDAQWWQIQAQGCDANFTLDGTDPTSASPFKVDDGFTTVWARETLRVSRWSRQAATSGTLVMQPLEA
jgi:hypothetical protein